MPKRKPRQYTEQQQRSILKAVDDHRAQHNTSVKAALKATGHARTDQSSIYAWAKKYGMDGEGNRAPIGNGASAGTDLASVGQPALPGQQDFPLDAIPPREPKRKYGHGGARTGAAFNRAAVATHAPGDRELAILLLGLASRLLQGGVAKR